MKLLNTKINRGKFKSSMVVALVLAQALLGYVPALGAKVAYASTTVNKKLAFSINLLSSSVPLTGTHTFNFTIYDALTAGSSLWTEGPTSITSSNGTYTSVLGNTTAIPDNIFVDGQQRYLEITLDGTNTLSPRLEMASSPYSFITKGVSQVVADPSTLTASKGELIFNTTTNTLKVFDGTAWVSVGGSGGSFTTINSTNNTILATDPGTVNIFGSTTSINTINGTTNITGDTTIGGSTANNLTINSTTVLQGPTTVNNTFTTTANTTLGDSSADILTVNATSVFNSPATFNSTVTFASLPSLPLATGAMLVGNGSGVAAPLSAGTNGQLLIVNSGTPTWTSASGDATMSAAGAFTLANSGVTASSYTLPSITVDAKGRVTAATSATTGSLSTTGSSFISVTGTGAVLNSNLTINVGTGNLAVSNPEITVTGGTGAVLGGGVTITIPDANSTTRGLVTTGAQNFAGVKNFTSGITVASSASFSTQVDVGSNKVINVATPTNPNDAVNKAYVDSLTGGVITQGPVVNIISTAPGAPTVGDRYIIGAAPSGFTSASCTQAQDKIAQWNGTIWVCDGSISGTGTPSTGWQVNVTVLGQNYNYNGSAWVATGSTTDHNTLVNLQGGQSSEYYHLKLSDYTALTSGTAQLSQLQTSGAPTYAGLTVSGTTALNGVTYTWPATQTAGYVLSTNGSGTLSWVSALTATLPSGQMFIGNGANLATAQTMSGDATLNNSGVLTVAGSIPKSVTNDTNVTGSIAANVLTLGWTGQLDVTRGGTGLNTATTGDMLYASAANTYSRLGVGSNGQVLTVTAGLPAWSNSSSLGSITLATGTTGTDVNVSGSPASLGGTLTLNIPDASATNRGLVTTGAQTIAGDKTLSGNTAVGGTLGVTGTSTLTGAQTLVGNTDARGTIADSTGNLTIGDDTDLTGNLTLTGNQTTSGTLGVTGTTTLAGNLNSNGNTALGNAAADTLTINATLQGGTPLVFEGATADTFTSTFAVTDPTANRTITFKDASGTVAYTTDIGITSLNGLSTATQTFANDTNITVSSAGSTHTIGWTGTLAAGRLNSNVVQGITNDTNITGTISSQTLTLGFTGQLSVGRGGTGAATFTTNGVLLGNGTSAISATSAPTAGQLLLGNAGGVPTFTTVSGDATVDGTGALTLSATGVTAASYGTASTTIPTFTVDSKGRLTAAGSYNASTIAVAGDVSGTLATTSVDKIKGTTVTLTGLASGDMLQYNGSAFVNITPASLGNITLATGTTGTDVNVSGSPASLGGTLTINIPDASATNRGLVTTGAQTIAGDKTLSGNTAVGGTLGVTGATTLGSTLGVTGTTTLNGNTSITGTNTFTVGTGSTTLGGNASIAGTLGVTGATTLSSTLGVAGASTFNGNVSITGTNTLTVGTGLATFGGNMATTGTLTQTGAATFAGLSTMNGGAVIANAAGLLMNPFNTAAGNTSPLVFAELAANGTNFVGFKAADAITANVVWTLPSADGTSGQFLRTNGSGMLTWGSASNTLIADADTDTYIYTENSADEDIIRFGTGNSIAGYGPVADIMTLASNGFALNMGTASSGVTTGAPITITAGTGSVAHGGDVTINGGAAGSAGQGGDVTLVAGTSTSGFSGGDIRITAGATDTGTGGAVVLSGGSPTNGQGGSISLVGTAGNGTNSSGGYVSILTGAATGSGVPGYFLVGKNDGNTALFMDGSTGNFGFTVSNPDTLVQLGPIGTAAGNTGVLSFRELDANGQGFVGFKAADALASSVTWTLPDADGTSGQVLSTNGSGILSWTTASGGSSVLSSLTAATATNTINNANFAQTWNWNSATTQNPITLGATSLTTGSLLTLNNTSTASTNLALNVTGSVAYKKGSDYTTPGSANNVDLGNASLVRLNSSGAAQTITGIANGSDGEMLVLMNVHASNTVTLANNSSSSTAANRIISGTGSDVSIAVGASVILTYDSGASFWRVVGGSSGGSSSGTGSYIQARMTSSSTGGGIIPFDTEIARGGSNATLDTGTGRFLLKANKTYRLTGHLGGYAISLGTLYWKNETTGLAIGAPSAVFADYPWQYQGTDPTADTTFTPSSDTYVSLYLNGGSPTIPYNGGYPSAFIQELTTSSSTALSNLTAASGTNTIDSLTNSQTWNWSTATTQTAFTLQDASASGALTTGGVLAVKSTSTALTGTAFSVDSASTSAFTNGGVRFNFTGNHTGNGFQINDVTTGGTAAKIIANSVSTGKALDISATGLTTGNAQNISGGFAANTGGVGSVLNVAMTTPVHTTGTNTHNALNITPTIFSPSGGTNSVNLINLMSAGTTGNANTTLTAMNVGALTGSAATERAIQIGSGWDCALYVNATCAIDGNGGGSASLSGLSAATATNTINNANFAQTWNWNTATTESPLTLTANTITTGKLLSLSSTNTTTTGNLLSVTSASTGNFGGVTGSGVVNFNLTGAHTGAGFQIDDVTTTGTTMRVVTPNLTTGNTALIASTSSAQTGPSLYVIAGGNGTYSNGAVRFQISSHAGGTGFLVSDTTFAGTVADFSGAVGTGKVLNLSSTSLTTGSVQNVIATFDVNNAGTGNAMNLAFTTGADSSGTNIHNGFNITPVIGNATGGTNTANLINIGSVTGDAQVTTNAFNIGALTGSAATERAIQIGSGWDCALYVSASCVVDGTGAVVASASLSGITPATATNTINNANFAQTWNWDSLTTQNALTVASSSQTSGILASLTSSNTAQTGNTLRVTSSATGNTVLGAVMYYFNGGHTGTGFNIEDVTLTGTTQKIYNANLTTGKALSIDNASNGLTTAGSNLGSLINANAAGNNSAFTGSLASIGLSSTLGAAGNTGSILNLYDAATTLNSTKLINATSASTGATNVVTITSASTAGATNGLVRLNFTGAHTGNGFQIDDVSTAGNAMQINANTLTGGGNGLVVNATNASTSGNALQVNSGSTATTNGSVLFNFTGNRTSGVGFKVADVSTSGTTMWVNNTGVLTGSSSYNALITANSATTGTVARFEGNAITSGSVVSIASTGTATTGNLLGVQSASTSTFSNGGVRFNFTGAHLGSAVQIDDVTTNGQALSINTPALTVGDAMLITGSGASLGAGSNMLFLNMGAATTGRGLNVTSTGVYTNTLANSGLINVTANSATTGDMVKISTTGLTSGTAMEIIGGTSMTTNGELIDLNMGAATAGNGLAISTTGVYTGTGLATLTANSMTTGTLLNLSSTAMTTGSTLGLASTFAANSAGTGSAINLAFTTGIDTTGTNTHNGINITPVIGNATGGTNTANLLNIGAIVGDAEVTTNAFNIGALTGTTATERAIQIGSGWDCALYVASTCAVDGTGAVTGSGATLSGLTAATATNTINNANFAQTWNWSTATTENPFTIGSSALTSGNLLTLDSSGTSHTGNVFSVSAASTAAITNGLARFNFTGAHTGNGLQIDDVTTTGNVAKINANSLTSGKGLLVSSTGTTTTGNLLQVTSASNGNFGLVTGSGGVNFNFTGTTRSGNAVQIDDANDNGGAALTVNTSTNTSTAAGIVVNANSMTSGFGNALLVRSSGAYTGTNGIGQFQGSSTSQTGPTLRVDSASTAAATSGLARFNFSGAHTGNGIQVDDVTTTGTVAQLNGNSVTSGKVLSLSGTSVTTGTVQNVIATFAANNAGTGYAMNLDFTTGTDSSGTNTHNGFNINPVIGNATGGTNTANLINIGAVTGDAQVTTNAFNIGALTGTAATERAIQIGSGWDCALYVAATCAIDGTGVISATTALSGITAATAANSIDNDNFDQSWTWSNNSTGNPLSLTANSTTTGNLLSLSTNGGITGGSTLKLTTGFFANSGTTGNSLNMIFSTPVDTSGTNTHQGINISPTIGNATGGTNTANLINIGAVTGDAQVTTNAFKIGALTGTAATERAIQIGSGWDCALYVAATCAIDGSGGGSASLSGLSAATATNSINNANFAQNWNWNTATTETAMALTASTLTTGKLLSLSATNTTTTGNLLSVTSASTGNLGSSTGSGIVNFNLTGAHTGVGFQIDDVATSANIMRINATSLAGGNGLVIVSPVLTTGSTININTTFAANNGGTGEAFNMLFTTGVDTTGTNTHNGLNILPIIGDATGGTNTANLINIGAITGDAQVTTNAFNIGALTGTAATERAIQIGSGWDCALYVNATCAIDGNGGPSASLSGLSAATAINTINNADFVQTWNWNTLTSGLGLKVAADAMTSGELFTLSSTSTSATGQLLQVTSATTGSLGTSVGGGIVNYNFTGAHTGAGFHINDVTTTGIASRIATPNLTTGTALALVGTFGANNAGTGEVLDVSFTTGVDTTGTNVHNAINVGTAIGNATGGTNTANLLNFDPIIGDAQVSLNAINIGALTATAANERAIQVGANWDCALYVNGTCAVNGTGSAAVALSGLTAAGAANTIDNTNFGQIWNWSTLNTGTAIEMNANALTSGSLINLSTSNASYSSSNGMLYVENNGSPSSGTAASFFTGGTGTSKALSVTHNGGFGTNGGAMYINSSGSYTGSMVTVHSDFSTAGKLMNFESGALSTGTVIDVTANNLTSGSGFKITGPSTGTAFTGNLSDIGYTRTSAAAATESGTVMNLSRSLTSSSGALDLSTSSILKITDTQTSSGGTFNHTNPNGALQITSTTTSGIVSRMDANSLTSGVGMFTLSGSSGLSGSLGYFGVTGNNAANTGNVLKLESSGASNLLHVLSVNSNSTGNMGTATGSGIANFNFTGAHTGNGMQIDDVTTTGNTLAINATGVRTAGAALQITSTGITAAGTTTSASGIQIAMPAASLNTLRFARFTNAAGTEIGSINNTNATTIAYATTSDARLKTDTGNNAAGLTELLALPVHNFSWKETGDVQNGFFAQELYEVVPEAVTVGSSETDANGKLVNPWSVDYGRVTPLVVRSVQDLNNLVFSKTLQAETLQELLEKQDSLSLDSKVTALTKVAVDHDKRLLDLEKFISGFSVVTGNITIDSLDAFAKEGLISIESDVDFHGHLYASSDTTGTLKIEQGMTQAEVKFGKSYKTAPNVVLTLVGTDAQKLGISYAVTNRSIDGFTVEISQAVADKTVEFSWIAIAPTGSSQVSGANNQIDPDGDPFNTGASATNTPVVPTTDVEQDPNTEAATTENTTTEAGIIVEEPQETQQVIDQQNSGTESTSNSVTQEVTPSEVQ